MKNEKNSALDVKAQFAEWCQPKRGKSNPENMTNGVWTALIENEYWPHKAHENYGSGEKQSPGWCMDRYGQSETMLEDGTAIFIGGEHEDFYDEDFYIYNDVIIRSPQGEITIYGYPEDVFPPTDSHSATLIGGKICIIGCIGYPAQRDPKDTPVYILNLKDYSVTKFKTSGMVPPWLYQHEAKFSAKENAIYCEGGEVQNIKLGETVENIATWRLCLASGEWACTEVKDWTRWRLTRADDARNNLYNLGSVLRAEEHGRISKFDAEYRAELLKLGYPLDVAKFKARYTPPITHETIESDNFRRHIIIIDGVTVRYDEDSWDISVTVEGQLPQDMINVLKDHGVKTFSELEATPYKIFDL